MAYATLNPSEFDLDAGYFPHEAGCCCDFCLPWEQCSNPAHVYGGDCMCSYDAEAEARFEEEQAAAEGADYAAYERTMAAMPMPSFDPDDLPFD